METKGKVAPGGKKRGTRCSTLQRQKAKTRTTARKTSSFLFFSSFARLPSFFCFCGGGARLVFFRRRFSFPPLGFFNCGTVVGYMRGQASLELFFSVSLFVLMLFWMNHFVGVASDASSAADAAAVRSAALTLQESADASCLAQASILVRSPCLSTSEPLVASVSGRAVSLGGVSVPTRCAFQNGAAVAYACGSPWCVAWNPDGTLTLVEGSCP